MNKHVGIRCERISEYMVKNGCTVRDAAKIFGVSKSTVHKDVTKRIFLINAKLAQEVRKVLDRNKEERSVRGGQATKKKYAKASNKPHS